MFDLVPVIASITDLEHLNQLIYDSRQHNGYDENNNAYFIANFGLTTDYINNQFVFFYKEKGHIIAMFGLSFIEKLVLDYFFVSPEFIGKGFGKKMWHDVCHFVKAKNWSDVELVSNAFSVPFYCHMGAEIVADYENAKNGSKIMRYRVL